MSRFVRPSKYRHVYGSVAKKEECYDNIKVSNNAWDTNLVAANGRYISVNWNASGGGAFAIIPVSRPGKLPDIFPLCRGHTASVLDTAFSPFDDSFVASASDDGTVGLWRVDDSVFDVLDLSEKEREKRGGIKDIQPLAKVSGGGRKIGQVLFHPTASNVLAAATGEHVIKLYDVESQTPRVELKGFTDSIQSLDFDWTGSTLVATCRDRKIRLFDTRKAGDAVQVSESHGGIKGARVAWCGSLDRIITTGFSKMSDRQLYLWDTKNFSEPLRSITVDSSSGVMMPFWSDNNIAFLAGKGDGNIRYYELESDELHYLTEFGSSTPQRGLTFIPRRDLNASDNEIARAYKVSGNMVQPISFLVPRRAESFQSDIFPPAPSNVAALSAAEFFSGKTATPNLVSLEDGKTAKASAAVPSATPAPSSAAPAAAASSAPASSGASIARAPSPTKSTAASRSVATPTSAAGAAAVPASKSSLPSPTPTTPSAPAAPASATSTSTSSVAAPLPSEPKLVPPSSAATATSLPSPVRKENGSASGGAVIGSGSGSGKEASDEVAELKRQLAEKDRVIRELEQKVEKLETNQARVREALAL